jgi:peptide/nickel transport system substrate-binding protein
MLLIQLLAHLTWHLSGAGKEPDASKLEAVNFLQQRANQLQQIDLAGADHTEDAIQTKSHASQSAPVEQRLNHTVSEWSAERGADFRESPMLQKLVESGELPPVSERLPENPLVIVPPEQVGPYGGTWTRFATGPGDIGVFEARLAYDGLVRWGPMAQEVLPNLASHWKIENGGRSYTFWLRRGVRWSDGHPLTVDDILFWYKHVLHNTDLTPSIPPEFQRDGETMKVEKIDDYTIRFRFKSPHGLFLKMLASGSGYNIIRAPAHYLKQYHPDFVPKTHLEEMAKKEGFDLWFQLYQDRAEWRNPEIPRIWPWIVEKPPPAQPVVFKRNPYYWKVDPNGNQLPYIDYMTFEIYDPETINLKAINGEMGMQGRHLQFSNYPLFREHSKKRGYRVMHWISAGGGDSAIALNLNHKDPVLRKIVHDRRFRIALSHAINRVEINEIGFFGVGKPRQMSPPAASAFYSLEYENAYIEYDPDKANNLLDEMGLNKRNKSGIRLRPDGETLKLSIEMASVFLSTSVFDMIAGYWTDVGVKTELKLEARQLFYTRKSALMHDVGVWGSADELIPLMDPRWFFPHSAESIQGIGYSRWYRTNGKQGEEPPPEIKECMELYRQIEQTPDEAEQIQLFRKIIDLNYRNLWVIGLIGDLPSIFLVKDTFRNVPEKAVAGWVMRVPGNTAPECYAIEGKD